MIFWWNLQQKLRSLSSPEASPSLDPEEGSEKKVDQSPEENEPVKKVIYGLFFSKTLIFQKKMKEIRFFVSQNCFR